jgi:hypothetical protein
MAKEYPDGGSELKQQLRNILFLLSGVAGLMGIAYLSIHLGTLVSDEMKAGKLSDRTFWKVIAMTSLQTITILTLAYLWRGHIGEEGLKFIKELGQQVRRVEASNHKLTTEVIPSFVDISSGLPRNPDIISEFRQSLTRLERSVTVSEIIRRNVISFGTEGEGMLENFFNDDKLLEGELSDIRFIGTLRGVTGDPQLSFKYFKHLREFFLRRDANDRPLFKQFKIIGPRHVYDHFCVKFFILGMLRWIYEEQKSNRFKGDDNRKIEFQVVYSTNDVFPAIALFGKEKSFLKALVAFTLGHADRRYLGSVVPVGLQISRENVVLPDNTRCHTGPTLDRIESYFEECFLGPEESRNEVEVWGLDQGQFYLKNLNFGVLETSLGGSDPVATLLPQDRMFWLSKMNDFKDRSDPHTTLTVKEIGELKEFFRTAAGDLPEEA